MLKFRLPGIFFLIYLKFLYIYKFSQVFKQTNIFLSYLEKLQKKHKQSIPFNFHPKVFPKLLNSNCQGVCSLCHSPVRARELLRAGWWEEGPAAVPAAVTTTGVAATREWRRHLQERHAGGGKVGALTWPWGVGGSSHGNRAF